ncbi:hypothetical protein TRAPUB_3636 [Trametes pubescens]|uniref:Uncharacterized protein n=1 Tax=Trametes pubescens TaxID=154538 RepID=A0A1M2VD66_TRAPU|nr:hypothetical protein TRAPUB_3636 [Trametes pubescens]
MPASPTIARHRRLPGTVLTKRDRSRRPCSSGTGNKCDCERRIASPFNLELDEPAAEDGPFGRRWRREIGRGCAGMGHVREELRATGCAELWQCPRGSTDEKRGPQ